MGTQERAPFLDALLHKARAGGQAFHTPGHKGGRAGDPKWRSLIPEALALDVDPPALPSPKGTGEPVAPAAVVREAECLLAGLYGARRSYFLVNGSTAGLQALALATVPNGSVLLPRNAHRSVLGALALAGARPWYPAAAVDRFWGLPVAPRLPTPSRFPEVQAVFATCPDYYGLACDLPGWRTVLGQVRTRPAPATPAGPAAGTAGAVPLLVDEAHGAHLPFLPREGGSGAPFPRPALELGADAAVQSPHKLLGSLVQSAWLHLAPPRSTGVTAVDEGRVEAALATLTTTSPSFLLLASLDATRRWAAMEGRKAYRRLWELVCETREAIGALPGLRCLDEAEALRLGYVGLDPLKLTVSVRGLGLYGSEAEAFLRWRGIHVELADPFNVLFVLSPADTPEALAALLEGLRALAQAASRPVDLARLTARRPAGTPAPAEVEELLSEAAALPPDCVISPREALLGLAEQVPLEQATGRVSARAVGLYPPGIPLFSPGERITPPQLALLKNLIACGLQVDGLAGDGAVWVAGR